MVLQKLDMSYAVFHIAFKIEREVNYEKEMCKMNTKLIKSSKNYGIYLFIVFCDQFSTIASI